MRLYLDEHLAHLAIPLRDQGYDVQSTQDAGNTGLNDEAQLAYAAREDRHLVTYNIQDFALIASEWIDAGHRFPTILFLSPSIPQQDVGGQVRAMRDHLVGRRADEPQTNTVEFVARSPR